MTVYLAIDEEAKKGTYRLELPAQPSGILEDVDQDNQKDNGIQIFAVSFWGNLRSSPYAEGYDAVRGWPTYLASIKIDAENQDEVTGGKLIVWAPDDQQQFPTSFGADELLFTADDPTDAIQGGYSIIDLDQTPFVINRRTEEQVKLYEPKDAAIKDFSDLSYTAAFEEMFSQIRQEYAFNGIPGKEPDWDKLYQQLAPRVTYAESNHDARAYFLTLRDFTLAFKDGHVSLDGGDYAQNVLMEEIGGGFGFAVREIEHNRIIVNFIQPDGPAAQQGMTLGAEIVEFADKPVAEAIAAVKPIFGPYSTDYATRYDQIQLLTRAPIGAQTTVTFFNPGSDAARTVFLTAIDEWDSLFTNMESGTDPVKLPVEYRILESGIGYIKITTNYDDLNLIIRLFERALKVFTENNVPGLIIDMRQNSGGAWLGLAGFLTENEILMGQLEYFSEKTGKFEPQGARDKIIPFKKQYRFNKMALLVGMACYSACEIEAYGFSQIPGMMVFGETPTAGVEAEVARGQFSLPDGMSLQLPTGRMTLPDGSLFLEGKGVIPTQIIPITESTILLKEDTVLKTAEKAILISVQF